MEILLAEDNEDNYLVVKSNLRKVENSNLIWAKDGLEAKKLLENGYKPDIFLLDIQMPNIDGVTLSRWIRRDEKFKNSCIIAITASVFPKMLDRYKDNGIDYILEKPFSRKDFLILISKCNNKLSEDIKIIKNSHTINSTSNIIDIKLVAKEWGFENDEMLIFVNKFLKKIKEYSKDLYDAIEINDFNKINTISHSMRSPVGNLRLNRIYNFLGEIENLANNKLAREDTDFKLKYIELEKMLNSIELHI